MEQNPSREANNRLTSQEAFRFLMSPKPHYRVHKAVALLKGELPAYINFRSRYLT